MTVPRFKTGNRAIYISHHSQYITHITFNFAASICRKNPQKLFKSQICLRVEECFVCGGSSQQQSVCGDEKAAADVDQLIQATTSPSVVVKLSGGLKYHNS